MSDAAGSDAAADAVMRGWALAELSPWLMAPVPGRAIFEAFDELEAREPAVFVLDVAKGQVTLRDKSASLLGGHFGNRDRAEGYRQYVESVIKLLPANFRTRLAIYTDDSCLADPLTPVFAFQKPHGNRSILLPDPDMLGRGFPTANGDAAFAAKRCRAIFAGGTSGGEAAITVDRLRHDGAIPRVRAAEYFRSRPDVIFKLPVIVQTEDAAAVGLLRAMGYGDGVQVGWPEQLDNKFIISMDGNGATCTRVSITLSSNSVLLKYQSNSVLYYFQGMQPWVHYLPISDHEDIVRIIDVERRSPGFFAPVTVAAQAFAARYLTREATLRYTAELLRIYADEVVGEMPGDAAPEDTMIAILAHVQNVGDVRADNHVWAGQPGSASFIEGFSLWPEGDLARLELRYRAFSADGVASEPVSAGGFCGTSGRGLPIHGFVLEFGGELPAGWSVAVEAVFADGVRVGKLRGSTITAGPHAAALQAMSITVER